jgi:hypothetical protein
VCPFHKWCFDQNGKPTRIPYLKNPKKISSNAKTVTTYCAKDWCGLLCVYFHAEFPSKPRFDLPSHVETDLKSSKWSPLSAWNVGLVQLLPTDWVDQAGDWAHFHTLHNDFVLPWTTITLPQWISRIISISHELRTFVGEKATSILGLRTDMVDPHYIYFTDHAAICFRGKRVNTTASQTLEMYAGPAIMVFHIPFGDYAFKAIVTTTPCPGGSVMRVRTYCNVHWTNIFMRFIAWLLVGVSASQLQQDITILENRIRLKKPCIVPFDGPYMRTNAWLRLFYSEKSERVGLDADHPFQEVMGW